MSSVIIAGDVSGTVTLQAPSAAGSTVVTLPSSSMNMGQGGGSVASNTAFGTSALNANTTGAGNSAFGYQAALANTTGDYLAAFGWSALRTNTTGTQNTAFGTSALYSNTTGNYNVAVGFNALSLNTTSSQNTAVGYQAAYSSTSGFGDVNAFGWKALYSNTTGYSNTAMGSQALYLNTTASNNTAVGYQAGYSNTTGTNITAIGKDALYTTTGSNNTAVGAQSAKFTTTGIENSVLGVNALYTNTTGNSNVAVGYASLFSTIASDNTAVGYQAGYSNTTGGTNVFVGQTAGYNHTTGSITPFVGYNSGAQVTTGSKNTILGRYNGNSGGLDIRTSSNYIVLSDGDGNPTAFWDNTGTINLGGQGRNNDGRVQLWAKEASGYGPCQIGFTGTLSTYTVRWWTGSRSYVKGGTDYDSYCIASGAAASGGVYLAAAGTSWSSASDERLKDIIEPITDAANKVSTLRAVIGKYKTDEEGTRRPFLIAQDVQAVLPEAVTEGRNSKDDETDYLNIAYTEVIPLLVAAIKELKAEIDTLKGQA